jgi:hypothetical protein
MAINQSFGLVQLHLVTTPEPGLMNPWTKAATEVETELVTQQRAGKRQDNYLRKTCKARVVQERRDRKQNDA